MELIQITNLKDPICSSADFNADIIPGRSIVIHGQSGRRRTDEEGRFSKRFEIGDQAEYHSYNLKYVGTICGIGEKTITFDTDEGKRRLSILDFCRRNWNFDAASVEAENNAERMCI